MACVRTGARARAEAEGALTALAPGSAWKMLPGRQEKFLPDDGGDDHQKQDTQQQTQNVHSGHAYAFSSHCLSATSFLVPLLAYLSGWPCARHALRRVHGLLGLGLRLRRQRRHGVALGRLREAALLPAVGLAGVAAALADPRAGLPPRLQGSGSSRLCCRCRSSLVPPVLLRRALCPPPT